MMVGGQQRERPSTTCGTPMMSSGASWEPRSEMQGRPTASANARTIADLPIPGGPQMKTGKIGATFNRNGTSDLGVSWWAACMAVLRQIGSPAVQARAREVRQSHSRYQGATPCPEIAQLLGRSTPKEVPHSRLGSAVGPHVRAVGRRRGLVPVPKSERPLTQYLRQAPRQSRRRLVQARLGAGQSGSPNSFILVGLARLG